MTVLPRGARPRRGGRRPGWLLLTVLLVLAILASSALVFTDRVELLKLAVILALWAAVVAAFVSVIYRRQSDLDQAKARDLKLVYDLQLDREISARREYELNVETQLRRELASELRAQAADEVAALRAELAALRTNLEILFDADLVHRPAIETDRRAPRAAGRVTASRLDVPAVEVTDIRTEESPIIDVPAEPHPPERDWAAPGDGGAHRLPQQPQPQPQRRRRRQQQQEMPQPQPTARRFDEAPPHRMPEARQPEPEPAWAPPPPQQSPPPPPPPPRPQPAPPVQTPWQPPPPEPAPEPPQQPDPLATGWQPAPAEGEWIPAGVPGSNWTAPVPETSPSSEYVGRRRAPEPLESDTAEPVASAPPAEPVASAPPAEPVASAPPAMSTPGAERPRGRHSAPADAADPGRPGSAPHNPILATEPSQPPPPPPPSEQQAPRSEPEDPEGQHEGGQSVTELLARFQATPTGGGRRRRREE